MVPRRTESVPALDLLSAGAPGGARSFVALSHRDPRHRLRRTRCGHPAQARGLPGLRDLRARARRGRRVARQHLSGLRVRRGVSPVLVLVRAQPGLEPRVLAAGRRSSPTCSAPRASSASCRTCASATRYSRPPGCEADKRWRIQTSQGTYTADVFIAAMGALSEPALPDIPGLSTFKGKIFHSARWDHSTI